MTVEIASQILIVLGVLCLGFNLYQLSIPYEKVAEEINELMSSIKSGEASEKSLKVVHAVLYGCVPLLIAWLMQEAHFVMWLMMVVLVKFGFTGIWSYRVQGRILKNGSFSKLDYHLHQADYVTNFFLAVTLLLAVFGV